MTGKDPSDDVRAALADADRQIDAWIDKLCPWTAASVRRGDISKDEAKIFLLDVLALDPVIRAAAQQLGAQQEKKKKRKKSGAKPWREDDLCELAQAFETFKTVTARRAKQTDQALITAFCREHREKFPWLPERPNPNSVLNLIRQGKRLIRPLAKRLIDARRANLALGASKRLSDEELLAIRHDNMTEEELREKVTLAETANLIGKRVILASVGISTPSLFTPKK